MKIEIEEAIEELPFEGRLAFLAFCVERCMSEARVAETSFAGIETDSEVERKP
jgi:hypothetical protein